MSITIWRDKSTINISRLEVRIANDSAITARVQSVIIEKLGVDEAQLTPEATFVQDLGADSLDLVELQMDVEKEFNIAIPDADAQQITTVGQAIDYVTAHVR